MCFVECLNIETSDVVDLCSAFLRLTFFSFVWENGWIICFKSEAPLLTDEWTRHFAYFLLLVLTYVRVKHILLSKEVLSGPHSHMQGIHLAGWNKIISWLRAFSGFAPGPARWIKLCDTALHSELTNNYSKPIDWVHEGCRARPHRPSLGGGGEGGGVSASLLWSFPVKCGQNWGETKLNLSLNPSFPGAGLSQLLITFTSLHSLKKVVVRVYYWVFSLMQFGFKPLINHIISVVRHRGCQSWNLSLTLICEWFHFSHEMHNIGR